MGCLLQVDPTLTRADRLVGQVLGEVGALPDVFTELEINFFLLRRLLGVRTSVCPSAAQSSGRLTETRAYLNVSAGISFSCPSYNIAAPDPSVHCAGRREAGQSDKADEE